MSELNLRDARRAAQEFCAANLRECCAELNEWQTKGTLRDGKLRELGVLCEKYVGEHDGLKNAEAMVEFQDCAIVAAAPVSAPQQSAPAALQSAVDCARRVLSKFGVDSDWSEWRDLADALQEFDAARQNQQPAQRASVDTPAFSKLLSKVLECNARDADAALHSARAALISHIDAWGSAGSGAGAVPEQYTCAGKGGEYELIGRADGAGYVRGGVVMVYRDAATGALFYRTPADFTARMEKISAAPSNQSPAEEA